MNVENNSSLIKVKSDWIVPIAKRGSKDIQAENAKLEEEYKAKIAEWEQSKLDWEEAKKNNTTKGKRQVVQGMTKWQSFLNKIGLFKPVVTTEETEYVDWQTVQVALLIKNSEFWSRLRLISPTHYLTNSAYIDNYCYSNWKVRPGMVVLDNPYHQWTLLKRGLDVYLDTKTYTMLKNLEDK